MTVLDQREMRAIADSLIRSEASPEEIEPVVDWAIDAKFNATLFEMVVAGELDVFVEDGEVKYAIREETE